MSTLRTAAVANLAGTGSPDIVGGELSRARFSLNGTGTIAARDTYNVSSFVDNGTGDYTASFSTVFPNADYSAVYGGQDANVGAPVAGRIGSAPLAGSNRVASYNGSFTLTDITHVMAVYVGDRP